jgi:hypothetical protein
MLESGYGRRDQNLDNTAEEGTSNIERPTLNVERELSSTLEVRSWMFDVRF